MTSGALVTGTAVSAGVASAVLVRTTTVSAGATDGASPSGRAVQALKLKSNASSQPGRRPRRSPRRSVGLFIAETIPLRVIWGRADLVNDALRAQDRLGPREVVAYVALSPDPGQVALDPVRQLYLRGVTGRADAANNRDQVAHLAGPELTPGDRLDLYAECV